MHQAQSLGQAGATEGAAAAKNVLVLGGSYGGMHAATVLAQRLPPSHRVILIERNSHMNHLYVFPRFSVVPGHEHKAFIPYTSLFKEAPSRPPSRAPSRLNSRSSSLERRIAESSPQGRGAITPRMSHASPASWLSARKGDAEAGPSRAGALGMGGAVLGGEPSSPLSHKNRGASAAANPPRVGDVPEDGELEEVESDATTATPSDDGSSDDVSTPSFLSPRARQGRSRSRHSDRTASSSTEAESSHSLSSSYGSSTASSFSLRSGASASASKTGTTTKLQERMAEKRLAAAHQDAATDADNAAIEGTIAADVLKGTSRQEEALGRPEIEVTELGEAIDKGLDLTSEPHAETEASPLTASPQEETPPVAEGFEESSPHVVLQATVTEITPTHVTVTPADKSGKRRKPSLWPIDSVSIPYTHLVYALGSHLPDPLRTEARTKPEGVSWMREIQGRIKASHQIVLVGGGALGVEYATDIASLYPEKDVTLIHSRTQLLPNFDPRVHEVAYRRLKELGVRVVLGERLALTEGCPRGSSVRAQASQPAVCTPGDARGEGAQAHAEGMCVGDGRKRIKTTGGKEFECDLLLLCTGQQPNSALMAQLSPTSVDPATRLVRVHKTLQVAVPDPRDAAQQPFDARPPCGDCDCFLDKKAAGSDAALDPHEKDHLLEHAHIGVDGQDPHPHVTGRLRNVYAIGDVADAFGALNAGYQAWGMADIAAENIIREIDASNAAALSANSNPNSGAGSGSSPTQREKLEMAEFNPAANMLKLSLGMGHMVFQGGPIADPSDPSAPERPEIVEKADPEDLGVEGVWTFMANASTEDLYL